jgi:hypothetical protein
MNQNLTMFENKKSGDDKDKKNEEKEIPKKKDDQRDEYLEGLVKKREAAKLEDERAKVEAENHARKLAQIDRNIEEYISNTQTHWEESISTVTSSDTLSDTIVDTTSNFAPQFVENVILSNENDSAPQIGFDPETGNSDIPILLLRGLRRGDNLSNLTFQGESQLEAMYHLDNLGSDTDVQNYSGNSRDAHVVTVETNFENTSTTV